MTQRSAWRHYYALCKPRVVLLMLLTALVGMVLAVHDSVPWYTLVFGLIGIGLTSAAGAAINHLMDSDFDGVMRRTHNRPIPKGELHPYQALCFALVLMTLGLAILIVWVNALTALLTFLAFVGYAIIYTIFLKHLTPQNIVIGGASGAAPPLLGWVAVTGHVDPQALLLMLIIYAWTPPHFWALAIYRKDDYAKANIPMLPVTHGVPYTKLSIVAYTVLLFLVTMIPCLLQMSGLLYFVSAVLLGGRFLQWALKLYRTQDNIIAMKTFRFSIVYLMLLFVMLLVDHFYFIAI